MRSNKLASALGASGDYGRRTCATDRLDGCDLHFSRRSDTSITGRPANVGIVDVERPPDAIASINVNPF